MYRVKFYILLNNVLGYKKHQTRRHGIIFPKGVSRMKFKNILHKREEGVKNAIPEQVIENQSEETNQSEFNF